MKFIICKTMMILFLLSGAVVNAEPLQYQVIQTSETSLVANVTLIKGEKEAILIDVPFARSDAHRVVAEVLDSGKVLKAIVVTHDHPDHFFGLDVLSDAFPEAKLLAHPIVVKDMIRTVPIKFKRWSPMLGTNAPQRQVIPEPVAAAELTLEGRALKILGPMQGDHVRATVIWAPESKTLIAGDLVYNGVHVWLAEHLESNYEGWLNSLDKLKALEPKRVIAGHTKPGLNESVNAIDWTRQYIKAFSNAASKTSAAKELAALMKEMYPDAYDVADDFMLGFSSQVGAGEIPPWDE